MPRLVVVLGDDGAKLDPALVPVEDELCIVQLGLTDLLGDGFEGDVRDELDWRQGRGLIIVVAGFIEVIFEVVV